MRVPSLRPASASRTGTSSPTAWKATLCATLPSSTATACGPETGQCTRWRHRGCDDTRRDPGEPRATVKRLSLRDGRTRLLPENPAYEPIETIRSPSRQGDGALALSCLMVLSPRSRLPPLLPRHGFKPPSRIQAGSVLAPSLTRTARRHYPGPAHRYCAAERPAVPRQRREGRRYQAFAMRHTDRGPPTSTRAPWFGTCIEHESAVGLTQANADVCSPAP